MKNSVVPLENPLARHLGSASSVRQFLKMLNEYDRRAYASVAHWPTPILDRPLGRLSRFANHSKPWFLIAAYLALAGGPKGRRGAATGVAAIGVASLVTNQPMKLLGGRRRPARQEHRVPETRWVPMPTSTSFPSGHSASAAAFALAVADVLPSLRWPLRIAAGAVGFSRVYTGVHYPGDVIAGAAAGALVGRFTARAGRRTHG